MRSGTPSGDTPSSSGPRSERGRLAFLGRALACKLRHAAGKIHEMLMHLLERETEREQAFNRIVTQIARQAFAADHGDLRAVGVERRFKRVERWWMPGWPVRFGGRTPAVKPSPLLGQHTNEVLGEWLSLDADQIDQLGKDKII
jgi:crotonobetainyl-CoA:carnitine CoA-transferase CaiB-like acyl-CoA transferase